jgi:enamine deaminase RidA (YjgF/YER057c/UK114 family)
MHLYVANVIPARRRRGPMDMMSRASIFDHGVAWEEANSVTQAYCINGTIYISGQFSHDQEGFVDGDVAAQTRLTLANLDRVLAGFAITRSNLAYIEIYLTNPPEQFEAFVAVFKDYLAGHRPAATLIGVTSLASPGQLVEISAVAHAV